MTEPTDTGTSQPTIRLLAGLGNPGPRYARTRHNLGFLVLDELAARSGAVFRGNRQAAVADLGNVRLLKPLTFMNSSGLAIQGEMAKNGIRPGQLLVVQDDLDLDLGRLRFRFGGSSGGQKGVQDTINRIGKDFWRLKLGISATPAGWETPNWVLSRFRNDEEKLLTEVIRSAADAIEHCLAHGPESAANQFNGLKLQP